MINLNINVIPTHLQIHATNNYLWVIDCLAQQISTVCVVGKDVCRAGESKGHNGRSTGHLVILGQDYISKSDHEVKTIYS